MRIDFSGLRTGIEGDGFDSARYDAVCGIETIFCSTCLGMKLRRYLPSGVPVERARFDAYDHTPDCLNMKRNAALKAADLMQTALLLITHRLPHAGYDEVLELIKVAQAAITEGNPS